MEGTEDKNEEIIQVKEFAHRDKNRDGVEE